MWRPRQTKDPLRGENLHLWCPVLQKDYWSLCLSVTQKWESFFPTESTFGCISIAGRSYRQMLVKSLSPTIIAPFSKRKKKKKKGYFHNLRCLTEQSSFTSVPVLPEKLLRFHCIWHHAALINDLIAIWDMIDQSLSHAQLSSDGCLFSLLRSLQLLGDSANKLFCCVTAPLLLFPLSCFIAGR